MKEEFMEEKPITRSAFKYGGKRLDDLEKQDLIECLEAVWAEKNEEISGLRAELRALRRLIQSPLPIHSIWRSFAENALLYIGVAILAYSMGVDS